jgi:hypothetical protein
MRVRSSADRVRSDRTPAAPPASGPRGCRCARSPSGRGRPSFAIAPTICSARPCAACPPRSGTSPSAPASGAGAACPPRGRVAPRRRGACPACGPRRPLALPVALERAGRCRLGVGLHQQRPVVLGEHREGRGDVGRRDVVLLLVVDDQVPVEPDLVGVQSLGDRVPELRDPGLVDVVHGGQPHRGERLRVARSMALSRCRSRG